MASTPEGHKITLAGPGPWERRVHVEQVWGTVVTFDLRAPALPDNYDDIVATAVAYLHQVDAWFSTYRGDSPITMLRNGLMPLERTPTVVQQVLASCRAAAELTQGVFDPWAVSGGVDPSGYVKGWAAGEVANAIVAAGIPNVCVNAAGDIACRGQQSPDQLWAIGILNPYDTAQVVQVVHIGDGAVATSGLYERGRHIVNPLATSSGSTATDNSGSTAVHYDSATIVGPDAGLADALATASLIAGPHAATWFASMPEWSAYFIKDGESYSFGPAFANSENSTA